MRILSTLAALAVLPLAAGAQERGGARDVLGDPDKFFMHCAVQMNLAEISAGQLAVSRGQSQEVKDFGRMMVEDHTKANEELAQFMKKKGVAVPGRSDEAHSLMVTHLSKLQGEDFDREYMGLMVAEHAKAVADFEGKSKTAKDPELKQWVTKTLEHLKKHHEQAKEQFEKLAGGAQGAK